MAVALMIKEADLVFFDYGQTYMQNELEAACQYSRNNGRALTVFTLPLKHDQERRNFYLLLEAKRRGYSRIYTGNRNLIPWTDKYRDSNWLSLKLLGWLSNLDIRLPITGWTKKRIVQYVRHRTHIVPYNCYKNGIDPQVCDCVNCKELAAVDHEIKRNRRR
jgi:7-cyano-7-deazaguanine synthase in queuosine biosynthesis